MFKSCCCKQDVTTIYANEGVAYYECTFCGRPCDAIINVDPLGDYGHDVGFNEGKTENAYHGP